jgi:basic membrane protein A and related proteins
MTTLAKTVPADTAHQFHERERAIEMGRLQPFAGRIVDQAGTVRQASGTMGDAAIARMDYFVQGVVGSLPKP